MAEVRMPKMGDGMEEGTITSWLKAEGDAVNEGDPIAEIETDKANVEIPAEESGVLSKIIVMPGKSVPVGAVIAMIAGNAATAKSVAPTEAVVVAPPEPATMPMRGAVEMPESERVKTSPLARKMAQDLGIDLARITGTGPGGRVVERDVKAFQTMFHEHHLTDPGSKPLPPAPAEFAQPQAAQALKKPKSAPVTASPGAVLGGMEDVKPSKMREAIARRTVQSKQTIPHFYVTMIIEMDRAFALLKELNVDAERGKVTVNDLIVKACALAIPKVPQVNSTWTPDGIMRTYGDIHIGVAVGIEDGLIIPVIRDCNSKSLRQISGEAKALIAKARNNQLRPEEYSGGTFSVTNLGMMGVDEFIAIVNPPEAAILAVGGAVREAVVGKDDAITVKTRMKVTLSADHRLLDGVVAARFLNELKKLLEAPFSLLS